MRIDISDQIYLRPFHESDADDLAIAANYREVADYLRDKFPYPYLKRDAIQFIEATLTFEPRNVLSIVVHEKVSGAIGITLMDDIYRNNAELGYWLSPPFQKKGIMTLVVKQMIVYVFSRFPVYRIISKPFPNNLGSISVLEKNGFILEAVQKDVLQKNGKIFDELTYVLIHNERLQKLKSNKLFS
ncbi:GNAT family N-acetyltransferase [soil metagenome]